jgi:hypothetical protein
MHHVAFHCTYNVLALLADFIPPFFPITSILSPYYHFSDLVSPRASQITV